MRGTALPLAVAALLLLACRGRKEQDRPEGVNAVVTAGTAVAMTQAFPRIVRAIGTVTPRPGRFAELAAPSPTRVARIFVTAGQRVAEGDSLIEFERAPFDANAKSADAALAAAQHAYARAVRLVQAGILPQKDSDQAAADLAQTQAAAGLAHRSQQLATLRAPLPGVVTRMSAVLGASVDQTQPLVEVADPAALDVVFNVTPAEAARVHAGAVVTIAAGEGEQREALGEGRVTAVGAAVDSLARAVPVRASIPRPARSLKIGESVFGQIMTGVDTKAVAIPVSALVPSAGDSYQVFVVDTASVAHARPVTVGARTETLAEIVRGLEAGETVVTTGAYGVEDGTKIVPAAR
jgi:RND family efflux transporter MFP subunit